MTSNQVRASKNEFQNFAYKKSPFGTSELVLGGYHKQEETPHGYHGGSYE
jgi:hypothetical protein